MKIMSKGSQTEEILTCKQNTHRNSLQASELNAAAYDNRNNTSHWFYQQVADKPRKAQVTHICDLQMALRAYGRE